MPLSTVLFVGNSYTERNDLAEITAGLLTAAGAPESPTALTGDGFTWADHLERIEGGAPAWSTAFGQPWHRMVFQEQSQIPGFPEDNPEVVASRANAVALDGLAAEAGAETWLFMTWGRRDGDQDNPALYPDFPTMAALLDAGYLATRQGLPAGRPAYVAPAGRAFRVVWEDATAVGDPLATESAFYRLYSGDGSHPSPLGTALVACVLTTSFTGVPCSGLPVDGIDPSDLEWAQAAADEAVFGSSDLTFPWTSAPEPEPDTGSEPEPEQDPSPERASGCETTGSPSTAGPAAAALALLRRRRPAGA